MKYSMDTVGLLPLEPGQLKYMFNLIDYFSKWVEASAFVELKEDHGESFALKNIIYRYSEPNEIVTDNGL